MITFTFAVITIYMIRKNNLMEWRFCPVCFICCRSRILWKETDVRKIKNDRKRDRRMRKKSTIIILAIFLAAGLTLPGMDGMSVRAEAAGKKCCGQAFL